MLNFKGLNNSQEDLSDAAMITIAVGTQLTFVIAAIASILSYLYIHKKTIEFIKKYWTKICSYIEKQESDDDFYTEDHAVLYVKDILKIQKEYIKVCDKLTQLPKPTPDDTIDSYEVRFTDFMKDIELEYKLKPAVDSYKNAGYLNGRDVTELYENIDKVIDSWRKAVKVIKSLPFKFRNTYYIMKILRELRADDSVILVGNTWVIRDNGGPAMEVNRYVWWVHSHIVKKILKRVKKDFQKYQKQNKDTEND